MTSWPPSSPDSTAVIRVDYADSVDATDGYVVSLRVITYEGVETYCDGTDNCASRDVTLNDGPRIRQHDRPRLGRYDVHRQPVQVLDRLASRAFPWWWGAGRPALHRPFASARVERPDGEVTIGTVS